MTAWGLHRVRVVLGGRDALVDVDLPVVPGRVVAVVGGDGAGKSTVARTLARRVAPRQGRVMMPAAERIGAVLHAAGTYEDLTVAENLDFAADAYGVPRAARPDHFAHLLDRAGLVAARSRLAGDLSGGMRQKLGVICALVPSPDVVLLDEPTTGVDPVSRAEVWRLIGGAAADGAAVVVTTTYLDEAERAAHLLVLDRGAPVVDGAPHDVLASATGTLVVSDEPVDGRSWRHGRHWRTWIHDAVPTGARARRPGLEDIVIGALQDRGADVAVPA